MAPAAMCQFGVMFFDHYQALRLEMMAWLEGNPDVTTVLVPWREILKILAVNPPGLSNPGMRYEDLGADYYARRAEVAGAGLVVGLVLPGVPAARWIAMPHGSAGGADG